MASKLPVAMLVAFFFLSFSKVAGFLLLLMFLLAIIVLVSCYVFTVGGAW